MKLSTQEYNTLSFLAEKSKMDCWFILEQDKNQDDYVYDLENHRKMSVRQGVKQLFEGLTQQDWNLLDSEQSYVMAKLLGYCI